MGWKRQDANDERQVPLVSPAQLIAKAGLVFIYSMHWLVDPLISFARPCFLFATRVTACLLISVGYAVLLFGLVRVASHT